LTAIVRVVGLGCEIRADKYPLASAAYFESWCLPHVNFLKKRFKMQRPAFEKAGFAFLLAQKLPTEGGWLCIVIAAGSNIP